MKPPKNVAANSSLLANFKQNLEDVMKILPQLAVGLDVNVRYKAINDFEFTQECLIFDLLNINLYHGWLCDPQSEAYKAVAGQSYNQLQEKVVAMNALQAKEGEKLDPEDVDDVLTTGRVVQKFLDDTASQLTHYGLCKLHEEVRDKELCVFFRNNHFSTMLKRRGELYLLVTDVGYKDQPSIVWEQLDRVDGDAAFLTGDFKQSRPGESLPEPEKNEEPHGDDYELALQLQQQELKHQQKPKPQQHLHQHNRGQRGQGKSFNKRGHSQPRRRDDDEEECVLF